MLENNSCDQCVVDCKNMSDDLFPSEIFPALQEPGVAVYFLPGNVFPHLCDECSLFSHNHSSPGRVQQRSAVYILLRVQSIKT